MPEWTELLEYEFLGNGPVAWLAAIIAFLVTLTVLPIVKGFVSNRAAKREGAGLPRGLELLAMLIMRTSRWFIWVVAIWAATSLLVMPVRVTRVITALFIITFWLQVGLWAIAAIRFWLNRRATAGGKPDPQLRGSLDVLMFVAYVAVFAIVALLALDNLGVNITALVAGLGIGGIAIALAVQTVLSDLFASLSITLDKPFEVGDFLILGDVLGTVERIGIKSTRLRSLSGEQIIISNGDLLSSRLRNYKRMFERRVVFQTRVVLDTPIEKVRQVPKLIRGIVDAQKDTRFDRSHFMTFGEYSLDFETVYYVLSPDYNQYADTQQAINLALYEALAANEIELALPARTSIVRNVGTVYIAPEEDGGAGQQAGQHAARPAADPS